MADYDEFLYDDFPFADTHPDRLATIATLFGMRPAPPEKCRLLELGCGLGGNLVPMAASLPESEFVGIDASARQIEVGLREREALGLGNLSLIALDLRDVGAEFGEFDYIVCHGVYSWVDDDVQATILEICRRHLAPQGVAYVSYNTLPGWHARGMIRDILRRNVPDEAPAEDRVARAREILRFLADYLPGDRNLLARWLKSEVELLGDLSDAYVLYEHLVERNEPIWFSDFVARATAAGLRYVGDTEFAMMLPQRFGPDVEERLASLASGLVEMEQYLDLLGTRYFRRSLLCHDAVKLDRGLSGERLRGLRISSRMEALAPGEDEAEPSSPDEGRFKGPEGYVLTTEVPLVKAALTALSERRPGDMTLEQAAAEARARLGEAPEEDDVAYLGTSMLEIYAQGLIELSCRDRHIAYAIAERPVTTPLARHQAATGREAATTLRHQSLTLDHLDRVLLPMLDGTHDREALIATVVAAVEREDLRMSLDDVPVQDPETIATIVDRKLAGYLRRALLVDAPAPAPEPPVQGTVNAADASS